MSNLGNTIGQVQSIAPGGTMNQQSSAIQYPTGAASQSPSNSQAATSTSMQASPSQHSPMSSQSQAGKSAVSNADAPTQIVSRPRLQELVREVDPTEQLDEEVEELLLQLADDFIDTTMNAACLLAKHRHVPTVEVKDVQLHLERNWNMWIPGFGTDELRPYKRATVTEAHKQRMALIRKAIKKY